MSASYNSELSNQRLLADNTTIDTNNASIGSFVSIVAPGASIDLDPSGPLDGLYGIYYIQTDIATVVILPPLVSLIKGWRCRIILYSLAGTGSLTINDSSSLFVAKLTYVGASSRPSLDLIASKGTAYSWLPIYYMYGTTSRSIFVSDSTNSLVPSARSTGNFFAFSGAPGSTINVNTTTFVYLPWSTTVTGYYIDTGFFTHSAGTPTLITCSRACYVSIKVLIFINNLGGATSVNQMRLEYNSALTPSGINLGTVSQVTTNVYELSVDNVYTPVGSSFRVGIRKTATSAGTNPLDQGNTCINIQILFS